MRAAWRIMAAVSVLTVALALPAAAQAEPREKTDAVREFFDKLDTEYHGFYEARLGYRLRDDPHEKDMSIGEARYQFDLLSMRDWGDIKVKGDFLGDLVDEQADFDLREANLFMRPTDYMDVKLGRQVLTWGTGDLIFINDVFPKDWVLSLIHI